MELELELFGEKCGVFGVWGVDNPAELISLGLHGEQHRGQESCGIVTASKRRFYNYHGMGLATEVFADDILKDLNGRSGVGHIRYSTRGVSSLVNAQPIVADTKNGVVAIAHNGQFANYKKAKRRLQSRGCIFKTTSDTEIPLHNFALSNAKSIEDLVADSFKDVQPSYAIVMLTKNELVGIRDPSGVRPLVLGKLGNAYAFASETVAFDIIGVQYVGEVQPGELVVVDDNGLRRKQIFEPQEEQKCIFENIYFARPDSFPFSSEVTAGKIRKEFGRQIYREHKKKAEVVIPVPDSSNDAALGYHLESGIPYDLGLRRSHYIGRTFIEPQQKKREIKVRQKFNVDRSVVGGKEIIVVDDSIIRSNTSKLLIKLLREAGAEKIYFMVSSPPYKYSCYLGIDTADTERLVAHRMSVEEIRKHIGADYLGYLSKEGMLSNKYLKGGFCTYCFDGIERIVKK